MPGHDTSPPSDRPTLRRRYRVAALLGALGLLATAVAVGPASANEDDDRASAAPAAAALRSTGTQDTSGQQSDRLDPASISAAVSASIADSTESSSAASEVDGERIAFAIRELTSRSGAKAKAKTDAKAGAERSSNEETTTTATSATGAAATETTVETKPAAASTSPVDTKPAATTKTATGAKPATEDLGEATTSGATTAGIVAGDDADPETNMGPVGSLRSFTTTYGAPPLEIPGLEGVTDPEGDPIELVDAFIVEGVGSLEIDGTLLIYTPPSEPVLNPFAGIDIFYVDSKGASGVGHLFIEILPLTEPVCEVVELFTEELLVNREEGSTAFIIPETELGCDYYELELISTDGLHEPGYQTDQTNESWFVQGIGLFADLAEVVYTSPPTPDLPDDETAAVTYFPPISPNELGIRGWELRHTGEGGVNSISATLRLIPSDPPPPPDCEPIIVFEDVRLLNRDGDYMASVPFTPPTCTLPLTTVVLVSTDFGHQSGFQPEQDEEFWTLEAYDAGGNFLFDIEGPDDLPDDINGDFVYVEGVDLSNVAEFRVVHDAVGDGINSIDASVYIFFDDI